MNAKSISERSGAFLPTEYGDFQIYSFPAEFAGYPHLALFPRDRKPWSDCLVRIHSECLTGDVFASTRCDCGYQLDMSLRRISREGGVLIYLRQEGRGIGLENKLKAYALQDQGLDTVEANIHLGFGVDERHYQAAVDILGELQLNLVRLLSNNPHKRDFLERHGIAVSEMIPVLKPLDQHNRHYMEAKKIKLGHLIP